jgi:hypothetical protein
MKTLFYGCLTLGFALTLTLLVQPTTAKAEDAPVQQSFKGRLTYIIDGMTNAQTGTACVAKITQSPNGPEYSIELLDIKTKLTTAFARTSGRDNRAQSICGEKGSQDLIRYVHTSPSSLNFSEVYNCGAEHVTVVVACSVGSNFLPKQQEWKGL